MHLIEQLFNIILNHDMIITTSNQKNKIIPSFCICRTAEKGCFHTPINKTVPISKTKAYKEHRKTTTKKRQLSRDKGILS